MVDISKLNQEMLDMINKHRRKSQIFNGPEDVLGRQNDIVWHNDALYTLVDNRLGKKIANYLPVPLYELIVDDGNSRQYKYLIIGQKTNGSLIKLLPIVEVTAEEMVTMGWAGKLWGKDAHIHENKNVVRNVMMDIADKYVETKTIYIHTGWQQNYNTLCYMYHGGSVGGGDDTKAELPDKLQRYQLPHTINDDNTDRHDALHTLLAVADRRVIIPLLALVFLTPLNYFLRQSDCEPAFVMYLVGRTQSRKSTLAALILSFFGRFKSTTLPASFKDTINSLEAKAHILQDVILVVDDYHPAGDRNDMMRKMQAISRMYGDRCGKDRLSPGLTTLRISNTPRGNVIVTGEDIPDISQSGLARAIVIEMTPDTVPIGATLNASQAYAQRGVYAEIMRDYIDWLRENEKDILKLLPTLFALNRNRALKDNLSVLGRTGDNIAWLMIGIYYLLSYLNGRGIKDIDLLDAWDILKSTALAQQKYSADTTPTQMYIDAIKQLLACRKIGVNEIRGTLLTGTNNSPNVGYCDHNCYYFVPHTIYNTVFNYYKSIGITYPLTYNRIMQMLADDSISICSTGRYTLQKHIGDKCPRLL